MFLCLCFISRDFTNGGPLAQMFVSFSIHHSLFYKRGYRDLDGVCRGHLPRAKSVLLSEQTCTDACSRYKILYVYYVVFAHITSP